MKVFLNPHLDTQIFTSSASFVVSCPPISFQISKDVKEKKSPSQNSPTRMPTPELV